MVVSPTGRSTTLICCAAIAGNAASSTVAAQRRIETLGMLPPGSLFVVRPYDSKPDPAALHGASAPLQCLDLVERARPVRTEQSRQPAIGEQLAAGLALCAVIRLVVGVADALHRLPTARTRLAIAAVHRHLPAK